MPHAMTSSGRVVIKRDTNPMPFDAIRAGGSRSPNAIYGVWSLSHSCVALSALMVNILYANLPVAQSVKLNGFMKHNLVLVTNFLGVDPNI